MKKKKYMLLLCAALTSAQLIGCALPQTNPQESEPSTTEESTAASMDTTSIETVISDSDTTILNNDVSKTETTISTTSIQDEIAAVEALSEQKNKEAEDCMTQMDMNINAAEHFQIWDDELNSLWTRLTEELDATTKDALLAEQREWITRKEAAVTAAGMEAEGGSLQPLLESCEAADLTRVRVYTLAGILAEARGESFVIPDEIAASLSEADPDIDSVFSKFEGTYPTDETGNNVLVIQKFEDSDFLADNFTETPNWVVWYTHGGVFTDLDVLNYYPDSITFIQGDMYYVLHENIAGKVELSYGYSPDDCEEGIAEY